MNAEFGDINIIVSRQDADAIWTELDNKVDAEEGKGLSSNDFTDAEKTKLEGIEAGAEMNVQSDWTETDASADDYIDNRPGDVSTQEIEDIVDALE